MSSPEQCPSPGGRQEPAPYAIGHEACGRREHPDPWEQMCSPLVIDRHRILHSAAFRRLQYKSQVFLTSEGDHHRTRLTHTLEVANIARRLAERLGLNADLAEAAALGHDLGHPPFGHAGEAALDEQMGEHGRFDHNRHSLRVVEYLEHPYPPFRGLNLTLEVREALAKHASRYDRPTGHRLDDGRPASLEGQVASLADRLAYDGHDLEDGLGAEMLTERHLESLDLWREAAEPVREQFADRSISAVRRPILDGMLAVIVDDVAEHTHKQIVACGIGSPREVQACGRRLVDLSPSRLAQLEQLELFLKEKIYSHDRLVRMNAQSQRLIVGLFEAYVAEPRLMPQRFVQRIDRQGRHGVVCDYIAGMTDRFCQDEYTRICEPPGPE